MKSSWQWLSQDRGAQIAEFAAVVPMLIVVIFGVLWFGRAFSVYTTVNHATRAAAEAATLHDCVTCSAATVNIKNDVVVPILLAGHVDPTHIVTFGIDPVTRINPNSSPILSGFSAHLTYRYDLQLNGLTCCPPALTPLSVGVTINSQAQSKDEN